jgi:predicted hydrocarbon binding protein
MTASLNLTHRFDPSVRRHYLNDALSVLHCHHYATLYTQLALDAEDLGGVKNLIETGAEVFGRFLRDYYAKQEIASAADRIDIARQYWKTVGMGLIDISSSDEKSGTATMDYSHLDEGWLKKWGGIDRPINFFTQGFLAGVFSAVYDKGPDSYEVSEIKSLVKGDAVSEFAITMK